MPIPDPPRYSVRQEGVGFVVWDSFTQEPVLHTMRDGGSVFPDRASAIHAAAAHNRVYLEAMRK